MKNTIKISMIIIAGTLGIISCSSDDDNGLDTQKPVIVLNEPQNDAELHFGEIMHLNAEFSDNVGLASYKIEIHSAGDGHIHKNGEEEEWFYAESHPITGSPQNYTADKEIPIPLEINGEPIHEGHYHVGIYLVDTSGNEQQLF